MESAYAEALWKMLEKGMKPREAVKALHESLLRHGRQKLLPKIGRAFARLAAREEARNALTLTLARQEDKNAALRDVKNILDEMGAEAKDVAIAVDGSQIGGWRLEGRGQLLDASYKKYLLDMYNRATTGL